MAYSKVVLGSSNLGFVEYVPDATLGTANYIAIRWYNGDVENTAYFLVGAGAPGNLVAPVGSLYWSPSDGTMYLRKVVNESPAWVQVITQDMQG